MPSAGSKMARLFSTTPISSDTRRPATKSRPPSVCANFSYIDKKSTNFTAKLRSDRKWRGFSLQRRYPAIREGQPRNPGRQACAQTSLTSTRNRQTLRRNSDLIENGEAFLYNADIQRYEKASHEIPAAKRVRKLLLHRQEIDKLYGETQI